MAVVLLQLLTLSVTIANVSCVQLAAGTAWSPLVRSMDAVGLKLADISLGQEWDGFRIAKETVSLCRSNVSASGLIRASEVDSRIVVVGGVPAMDITVGGSQAHGSTVATSESKDSEVLEWPAFYLDHLMSQQSRSRREMLWRDQKSVAIPVDKRRTEAGRQLRPMTFAFHQHVGGRTLRLPAVKPPSALVTSLQMGDMREARGF